MPQVYALAYVSRCCLPADPREFSEHLRRIVDCSRDWNGRHGITSALTVSAGHFAQILEGGDAAAVRNTYGHICCDPRNRDHRLLEARLRAARELRAPLLFVDGTGHGEIAPARPDRPIDATTGHALVAMLRWLVQAEASA